MPAATTHVIFAKDVYKDLPETYQKEITNLQMFYMGSQGPDMLFFSNFSVLPGTLKPIGNLMHDEKVFEVISYLETHAHTDSDLRSYFDGYLCHYALDRHAHPYVCAVARDQHNKTGRPEDEIHFRIEGEFDIHMLHKFGKTWQDYSVYKDLKLEDSDVKKLAILYNGLIKHVFDMDVTVPTLMKAIKQVYTVTRLVKPGKKKYALVRYVEGITGVPKLVSGMMLSEDKKGSFTNDKHLPWHPLFDPDVTYTSSFDDLYEESLVFAKRIIATHTEDDFHRNFVGEPI